MRRIHSIHTCNREFLGDRPGTLGVSISSYSVFGYCRTFERLRLTAGLGLMHSLISLQCTYDSRGWFLSFCVTYLFGGLTLPVSHSSFCLSLILSYHLDTEARLFSLISYLLTRIYVPTSTWDLFSFHLTSWMAFWHAPHFFFFLFFSRLRDISGRRRRRYHYLFELF